MCICTCFALLLCMHACRLLSMMVNCFTEEPPVNNGQTGKEDKSFQTVRPWFNRSQPQLQPRFERWRAKAALRELVTRKDDLPACLIFYPVNSHPHSIQETWFAGIHGR